MGVSASIDIKIISKGEFNITSMYLIECLINKGWEIKDTNNKICYLPLNDDDMFDWQEDIFSDTKFTELVFQKENIQEIIGLNIFWSNSNIGISLLIYPNHEISLMLSINRVKINNATEDITDVSWYLEKVIPCFNTDNICIENIMFTQD